MFLYLCHLHDKSFDGFGDGDGKGNNNNNNVLLSFSSVIMCRIRNILKDAVIGLYNNPLTTLFWFVVLCMYVDTFPKFVSDNNFNGGEYDNDNDNDEQQKHVWYCTHSFVLGIYDFGYDLLRSIMSFFVNTSISVNGDDHSTTPLSHSEYPWREAELELELLASKVTTTTTTTWNHQILVKIMLMIPQISYLAYCLGYIFGDLLVLFLYIISCHLVYFYFYGNLREMKNEQQQQHHPCTRPPTMVSTPSTIRQVISSIQQTLLLGVEVPVNLRRVISNTISHVNDKAFDSFLFWFLIVVTNTATSPLSTSSSSTITPTADIEDIVISKLKEISIIGVLDFGRNWLFSTNGINDNDSDNENYEGDKMSYITMIGAIFTFLVFFCFTWGLFASSEEVEEEIHHQKEEKKKKIETTRTTRKVISDNNSNNYKKQIIGYGGGRRQFYSKKKKTIFTPTSSKAASASTTKPLRIAGSLTSRASCIDHNNNSSINKIQDNTHRDTASATYSKSTADVNINEKKNMNARAVVVVEDSQKNNGKVDLVTKCNEREHKDMQDNNATTTTINFKEIPSSSSSTTTPSDPLEAAFASLLSISSHQSGHAFSSDSKAFISDDATPMSMSPSKLSSSSCSEGNLLLSCAATAVTKVSCSNEAMPMSPKSWPTFSNIETTSFPRTDAAAADDHDDTAVLPQLQPTHYPRQILARYYNIKTKFESFVTWDNGIKTSGMPSFTSSFVCPITNEIFFAGPFSARGMQIAVKKKKMSEVVAPDEDGIYWYPCKKLAEHAAAARALDCLLMRDGGENFNSDDNFCALEPYMPADKQTWPGDNGIPDRILEQIVILARNSTRSISEDVVVVVVDEEGEEKCDEAEAVTTTAIAVVSEAIAVEAESLLVKEENNQSAFSLSLKQEDNDIVEQEDFEKASDVVSATTWVTIRKERNYYYEITVQQSGGDIPDLLLPSSSSLTSSPSPASSSSSSLSSWKRNFTEDKDTISTTTSSNNSSRGTEESGRSKDSCQFIVEMMAMETETVSQQQKEEHPSPPRQKRFPPPGFLRMKLLKEEREERARQQQAHEPAAVAPPPGFEQKLIAHQRASENGSLEHHQEQPIGPPPGFYPVSLHDHDD